MRHQSREDSMSQGESLHVRLPGSNHRIHNTDVLMYVLQPSHGPQTSLHLQTRHQSRAGSVSHAQNRRVRLPGSSHCNHNTNFLIYILQPSHMLDTARLPQTRHHSREGSGSVLTSGNLRVSLPDSNVLQPSHRLQTHLPLQTIHHSRAGSTSHAQSSRVRFPGSSHCIHNRNVLIYVLQPSRVLNTPPTHQARSQSEVESWLEHECRSRP